MTKIDIYSGFLGAGKTTLIKKMIAEAHTGEKLVLIENEFGEIGIDGGFLQEAGIQITEMNSGCICCSLVGDFGRALRQVIDNYAPDRILIEPSGVGKLSDVIAAVEKVTDESVRLGSFTAVVDASKCKMYSKNFGEFFNNQIETASTIILSRTGSIKPEKLEAAVALLREHNAKAVIITTPWEQLTGSQILEAMEGQQTLAKELAELVRQHHEEHHHHDDDEECDDPDCECHHHHHHDDEDECGDPDCECHHHHDGEHHHHHHHADEVFVSWGRETAKKFSRGEIEQALKQLDQAEKYGMVLRAKGIVEGDDGTWIHFDHVPEESEVRTGPAGVTGRLCVIGSKLQDEALATLFGV